MKVQIIVDGQVVNTQLVSVEALGMQPAPRDLKRMALRAALEDRAVTIPQSLKATFRFFDVMGRPIED